MKVCGVHSSFHDRDINPLKILESMKMLPTCSRLLKRWGLSKILSLDHNLLSGKDGLDMSV